MFLSEWREFPSAPCLAGKKETWWQLASRCCWNRARPCHASELVSFLVGLRTYQHPVKRYCNSLIVDTWRMAQEPRCSWILNSARECVIFLMLLSRLNQGNTIWECSTHGEGEMNTNFWSYEILRKTDLVENLTCRWEGNANLNCAEIESGPAK